MSLNIRSIPKHKKAAPKEVEAAKAVVMNALTKNGADGKQEDYELTGGEPISLGDYLRFVATDSVTI